MTQCLCVHVQLCTGCYEPPCKRLAKFAVSSWSTALKLWEVQCADTRRQVDTVDTRWLIKPVNKGFSLKASLFPCHVTRVCVKSNDLHRDTLFRFFFGQTDDRGVNPVFRRVGAKKRPMKCPDEESSGLNALVYPWFNKRFIVVIIINNHPGFLVRLPSNTLD